MKNETIDDIEKQIKLYKKSLHQLEVELYTLEENTPHMSPYEVYNLRFHNPNSVYFSDLKEISYLRREVEHVKGIITELKCDIKTKEKEIKEARIIQIKNKLTKEELELLLSQNID